jgi:hypothetical protein
VKATAAALDAVEDAAELEAVLEPEPAAVLLAVLAALEEEAALTAEAFFSPQAKDWQKVWPLRSLGCAAVHWPIQFWHSRDGSVWP